MTETCLAEPQTDTPSTDLWTNGFFHLAVRQPAVTSALREVLRACQSPLGVYLADVETDDISRDFTKEQVAEVEKAILNHFKLKETISPLLILKDAVYQLNRGLQKCIPTPRLVDRLQKDPNLLTEEFTGAQSVVALWLKAEQRWIDYCCSWDSAERSKPIRWEMVIAFAALRSGNLSVRRAVALAEALVEPRRLLACSQNRAYADLPVEIGNGSDYIYTRWYPTNPTLLLMCRVNQAEVMFAISDCSPPGAKRSDRRGRIAQRIVDGINREFSRAGVEQSSRPKSLKEFLATIALSLRSKLPCTLSISPLASCPAGPCCHLSSTESMAIL